MRFAVLFPGQGSQFVGMGADLFASYGELLVEQADAVLGWSRSDLCSNGPEEALTATDKAQPALYATSFA
ncbi:MAG: acyltransferase domain-containing protein, partial [Acidimicrobiia bacterium]|nr:acyltransferase domain-containing protein [Acidimicrobiia bacterium]